MTNILLLETDKVLAENVSKILQGKGFSVNWQVDPQEAILDIDKHPVDLIILDLVLAGHSGVEFLYEFRSYPDWQKTPVVVYTSLPASELDDCGEGLRHLSIGAYLYKPTTPLSVLADRVQASLQPVMA